MSRTAHGCTRSRSRSEFDGKHKKADAKASAFFCCLCRTGTQRRELFWLLVANRVCYKCRNIQSAWLPSPPRAIVSGIFFGYRGVGAASGLNSNCAVRKCTRAPGKMMCASRLAHARRDLDCSAIRSTCLQLSSALHARLCFCDLVRIDGRVREELA